MREKVLEALAGFEKPASAYDIAEAVSKAEGRRVAANSVYRIGIIDESKSGLTSRIRGRDPIPGLRGSSHNKCRAGRGTSQTSARVAFFRDLAPGNSPAYARRIALRPPRRVRFG